MSKAIRIHAQGGPEVMSYEDVTLLPPGPREVRIRHHAIGVNFLDVYYRKGVYPAPSLPFTPGNEGAGQVIALGEGVRGLKKGDRVAYVSTLGSYSEERNVPAASLVPIPEGISYATAAALMLKGLTAHYLLRRTYRVKPGDIILNHAAAGGVGLILGQWANALGATVIGTVGTDEKAKLAKKKGGCHHVINYRTENFAERVAAITKGEKCHVVYDGVGKDTFPMSLDCLRPLGMFVSFGSASGQIDEFNINILSKKGSLFVTRPTLFSYIAKRTDLLRSATELFEMIEEGYVKIPVHAKAKLSDAIDIHRALESRSTTGATILIP